MFNIPNLFQFKKNRKILRDYKFRIQNFFKAGYDENQNQREDIPSLNKLGITDIELEGKKLVITLQRPGLLIGLKGKTLDELYKYLSINERNGLKIVESKLWN